jgi:hypothetical protein
MTDHSDINNITPNDVDVAAHYFTYEISDDALEASAADVLLSGSSNPGVNCSAGCR